MGKPAANITLCTSQAMDSIYAHACKIVANFDFIKVQKMMEAVEWKWGGPYMNGEFGIPTVEAMQANSMQLILEAYRLDSNVSAGGLEAYWIRRGGEVSGYKGNGCVGLRFIGACYY
jgi:hypothetical protein